MRHCSVTNPMGPLSLLTQDILQNSIANFHLNISQVFFSTQKLYEKTIVHVDSIPSPLLVVLNPDFASEHCLRKDSSRVKSCMCVFGINIKLRASEWGDSFLYVWI